MESVKELCDEAKELIIKLLPPSEYGEDYDVERLYEIIEEIKQYV